MDDVKQFLYSWLGKNRKTPNYEVTSMNSKGKPRFKCELRVEGYAYIGIGNSTNKKSAQTNAAHDFCQYLARTGCMNPNEIPALKPEDVNEAPNPVSGGESLERSSSFSNIPRDQGNRGNFGAGRGGFHGGFSHNNLSREEAFRAADAKMLREAEDADVNCEIHGFWTLENAKSRLHQYLQMNKINTTYKFQSTGPDNQRSFFAEMSFYVPSINKKIHAMEHGSTKHIASKACALSLIRQLYHYNLVEAYTGERKKKELPKTATFAVEISDELRSKLVDTLTEFNITPVEDLDQEPPVSLLPDQKSNIFPDSEKTFGSTIAWSPPLVNWNPWSGCNIDEGSLATMSLTEISDQLYENQLSIKANRASRDVKNDLPVNSFRDQVLNEIDRNSVIIIRGHTGCGKTTQIPQFILEQYLEAKRGAECNIVVTQPRRISAVSVAERVANERFEELGESIGYSVRFESKLPRPYGSILFCTVGVLLRKLEAGLRGVSHVVVDEIHERDINTDFLLVLLNDMLSIYKDLKVVLMSATIDTALFSSYFGNCPIIEIYGRTFPVQEYFLEDIVQMCDYCPDSTALAKKRKKRNPGTSGADDDDDDDDDDMGGGMGDDGEKEDRDVDCNTIVSNDYSEKTKNIMAQLSEKSIPFDMIECLLKYIRSLSIPGSVLVFLPGWNLIQSILKFLQQHPLFGSNQYILLPLHSQIPREDQYKVFLDAPPGKTKIILSTNIAESTITINDVVFVIDSCKVKQKIFTSRNNMTNYATIWASKSNLEQRKGRAGRVQSGFCFFLVSRARYERLDPYATPEIFRTPLLELALSIKLLRLGDIREFLTKAMEPPPIDQVTEAIIALTEMHALDKNEELTPLGRILARLPIEPKMGKFIILGCIMNIGDAVCTIAAASTFSEPFVIETKYLRPMHRNYAGKRCSDHIALFMAFQQWLKAKWHGEQSEQEFCERKALNMQILRMTFEARNQLKDIMLFSGFPEESLYEETSSDISTMDNSDQSKLDTITSLLSYALYPNVCYHTEKRKLLTHEGKLALIHKNSVNCSHEIVGFPSPFFVFGEKIKTRAVSAKSMTMVSPVQLIVFGADRVEFSDGLVCLDGWINLKMDVKNAALLASLRLALDHVISICTTAPDTVTNKPRHIELFSQCVQTIADLFGNHVRIYKDGNDSQPTGFNNSFNNRPPSSSNNLFNRGMGGGGYSNQMNPAKRFAPDHSMNMSSSFNRTFNRNVQGPPRSLMTGMSGNIGYNNQSNDDITDDIPDQRETQLKQQVSTPTSSRSETPSGNIPLPPHLLASGSIGEARKFNDSSDNFGSNQQQNFRNNNFNNNFGNNSFGNRNRGFGNQGNRGGFNGSFRGSFRGGRGGFNNRRF